MVKIISTIIAVTIVVVGVYFLLSSRAEVEVEPTQLVGTVTYREAIALPNRSVVEVQILDVSRADAEASVLAETTMTTRGENVPIPFTLDYDIDAIDPSMNYAVSARILIGDQLHFVTEEHIPFVVDGAPIKTVQLVLAATSAADELSNPTEPVSELDGMSFRFVSLDGEEIAGDGTYTMVFDGGAIGAKFCNNMGGQYSVEEGTITSLMTSTLMFCETPEGLMDAETAFGTLMSDGARYTLEGETLTLEGEEHVMIFTADASVEAVAM